MKFRLSFCDILKKIEHIILVNSSKIGVLLTFETLIIDHLNLNSKPILLF